MGLKKRALGLTLHAIPGQTLSKMLSSFCRSSISRKIIPIYAKFFNIDPRECGDLNSYHNLLDFFTRELPPGLRKITANEQTVISPTDGVISDLGYIHCYDIILAKHNTYNIATLLGPDINAAPFAGGAYINIYLSPATCHRIYMPVNGVITRFTYLPGQLFPVNKLGVTTIKDLYARNRRLVSIIQTPYGQVAMIKIGALIVGGINTIYGSTHSFPHRQVTSQKLNQGFCLKKGDELGTFEFGSTVVLLFENKTVELDSGLKAEAIIKIGQPIGRFKTK